MRPYEEPEIEIIWLDETDVITGSPAGGTSGEVQLPPMGG